MRELRKNMVKIFRVIYTARDRIISTVYKENWKIYEFEEWWETQKMAHFINYGASLQCILCREVFLRDQDFEMWTHLHTCLNREFQPVIWTDEYEKWKDN